MKKKLRIDLVLVIILVMCGFILSTFGFIHTMLKYTRIGNISKDDLQYEKLTFEKYEVVEVYKVGTVYEFYFEEYENAFCVHPFVQKKLNQATINELKNATKLEIYYKNSTIENSIVEYIWEICEIKDSNNIFLTLEDYKLAKQNQEIIVLIVMPFIFLLCIIMVFIIIKNRGLPSIKKGSR